MVVHNVIHVLNHVSVFFFNYCFKHLSYPFGFNSRVEHELLLYLKGWVRIRDKYVITLFKKFK
jgi:hypothetical protein